MISFAAYLISFAVKLIRKGGKLVQVGGKTLEDDGKKYQVGGKVELRIGRLLVWTHLPLKNWKGKYWFKAALHINTILVFSLAFHVLI